MLISRCFDLLVLNLFHKRKLHACTTAKTERSANRTGSSVDLTIGFHETFFFAAKFLPFGRVFSGWIALYTGVIGRENDVINTV
jgi:hypothetical protein